ncbi:MAG TPA: zinc ribbon domain-containing protein [Vicinamibacteria bacterium]|nr:zinc ribbon domain-containing protein [Vicinamibacteria bacterium]
MILVALALLGAAVVIFVLVPVFESQNRAAEPLDETQRRLQDLEETKLRLYEAIKDLDFEKDAGKVSENDFQRARNDYLKQVAEVLGQIDQLAPPKKAPVERKKRAPGGKKQTAARSCAKCGETNPADARFCMSCGDAFARVCPACAKSLPEESKFCLFCGSKVAS